jgi:hypothetical protein
MKYKWLPLLLLSSGAFSQSREDSVKAPILALFNGMRTSDTSLMRSAFAPGAILQTISRTREGATVVRTDDVGEFIAFIGKPHTEIFDERITFDGIRIDAALASAWTPYQFFTGNKFSHCGVNSFQLVQLKEGWKIQYIIDTRRKDACR